jgi:hypothetical protein
VGSVWVRAHGDVLLRADAIVALALGTEGLRAECGTGAAVRLTGTPCSTALMVGVAEVIDSGRHTLGWLAGLRCANLRYRAWISKIS